MDMPSMCRSYLGPREKLRVLQAEWLDIKRKEMELRSAVGDIELEFASMLENYGISTPILPSRQAPKTPSFLSSTPCSLTRVSALSNLAKDLTFCSPYLGKDQSLNGNTIHEDHTAVSDAHDVTFFSKELDKESEEERFEKDIEINQLVPVIDVNGEKIYRIVEGSETETSIKRRVSPIGADHVTLRAKRPTSKRQEKSHPRACSTFIGKDEVVETIADDNTSFWSTDDSFSTLRVDRTERYPRTSTRISLSPETDIHCVPDVTDSVFTANSTNSGKRHRPQKKQSRHLATGGMDTSNYSTLGSMGDDTVFEKSRAERKGVPKSGSLRRQTCITKLVDPKALVKKMKHFNNNKHKLSHTLLVV